MASAVFHADLNFMSEEKDETIINKNTNVAPAVIYKAAAEYK